MELKDIQELMQVLKKENLTEMKIKYGNVKLTLTNSETGQVTNATTPVTKKVQKNIVKSLPKEGAAAEA